MQLTDRRYKSILRQYDIVKKDILTTPITVIGAGAIGSWTVLALAKMGFQYIRVYDFDTVEIENMAGQAYGFPHIGSTKVHALKALVDTLCETDIKAVSEKFVPMSCHGVVISAVDSMEMRKELFEKLDGECQWLIDPRMGAEVGHIYTVKPGDQRDRTFYEKTLYSDANALQEKCTAKSTTYCAMVLSGLVAKTVRDTLMREDYMRFATFSLKGNELLCFPGKC